MNWFSRNKIEYVVNIYLRKPTIKQGVREISISCMQFIYKPQARVFLNITISDSALAEAALPG